MIDPEFYARKRCCAMVWCLGSTDSASRIAVYRKLERVD